MQRNAQNAAVIFLSVIFCLLVKFSSAQSADKNLLKLGKSPVKEVIAVMSSEEKAKLVVINGFHFPGAPDPAGGPVAGQAQGKVPGASGATFAKDNKVLLLQRNIKEYKPGDPDASGFIFDLNDFVM